MAYKSTRRQWVKLWVNEWLDGTSRFELTAQQRLLWVDLLALAGRSRFPGQIFAGFAGDNSKVGYPIAYLAGVLQMDEVTTNNALKLLAQHCHITLDESGPEQYVIGIINWEKYQSEYLRQKTYRKVTNKTTSRLPVEVEVEVEGEGEKKKEKTLCAAKSTARVTDPGFVLFWQEYPRKLGKAKAEKSWHKQGCEMQIQKVLANLKAWKEVVWKDQDFIPYPATWLNDGRWKESPQSKEKLSGDELERLRARLYS